MELNVCPKKLLFDNTINNCKLIYMDTQSWLCILLWPNYVHNALTLYILILFTNTDHQKKKNYSFLHLFPSETQ